LPEVFPKIKQQRKNGPKLDNNGKRKSPVIGRKAEEFFGNEQMRGGGNRDEFGQSLNNTE
jgi:hypothetical protein